MAVGFCYTIKYIHVSLADPTKNCLFRIEKRWCKQDWKFFSILNDSNILPQKIDFINFSDIIDTVPDSSRQFQAT